MDNPIDDNVYDGGGCDEERRTQHGLSIFQLSSACAVPCATASATRGLRACACVLRAMRGVCGGARLAEIRQPGKIGPRAPHAWQRAAARSNWSLACCGRLLLSKRAMGSGGGLLWTTSLRLDHATGARLTRWAAVRPCAGTWRARGGVCVARRDTQHACVVCAPARSCSCGPPWAHVWVCARACSRVVCNPGATCGACPVCPGCHGAGRGLRDRRSTGTRQCQSAGRAAETRRGARRYGLPLRHRRATCRRRGLCWCTCTRARAQTKLCPAAVFAAAL